MPAMTMPDAEPPPALGRGRLLRRLPILVILAVALTGMFLWRDDLSFHELAEHRDHLLAFRDAHYLGAAAAFVLAYVGIVAFSLPGATVATLTGGFLFGVFPGVLFNVTGATIGAVLIFLAARAGFGAAVAERLQAGGGAAARLIAALRRNEWSALLVMRLVPVVPFFVANLIPAFADVRTGRFAVTTFVGIVPATLVFTSVGAGLGDVFAAGGKPDLSVVLRPAVILPMLGLALLAALPMLLKLRRGGG